MTDAELLVSSLYPPRAIGNQKVVRVSDRWAIRKCGPSMWYVIPPAWLGHLPLTSFPTFEAARTVFKDAT